MSRGSLTTSKCRRHRCSRREPAAVGAFRQQGWASDALTPNAILHIEVQLPPTSHDVPLKAIERWLRTPSVSPREEILKRKVAAEERR
jgi:hypothetical protein